MMEDEKSGSPLGLLRSAKGRIAVSRLDEETTPYSL